MKKLVIGSKTGGAPDPDQLAKAILLFRNAPHMGGPSPAQLVSAMGSRPTTVRSHRNGRKRQLILRLRSNGHAIAKLHSTTGLPVPCLASPSWTMSSSSILHQAAGRPRRWFSK